MSERVPMPCENCGRDLWIRLRNVGRIGKCKYCGFLFRARMDDVFNLTPSPPSRAAKVEDESRNVRDQEPTRELEQGRGQLVAKDYGPASSRQRLAGERRIVLPQGRGPWSSEPFEPAPAPDQPSLASEQQWEAAHSPISEFRAELAALRDRADQVDHMKQRLRTELAEIEQIRAQLREVHPLTSDPKARAGRERTHEIEALRDECNRFQEEARALRSRMEAQSADERARSEDLTREYEAACAERERMRAELEAQASEMQRTRDLFGAEREALVREVEELQNRLEGLERAQDEAEYEHHQACAAWEEERQGLEAWSERQRQGLLEAERRSSELRAQFDAERQAWDRQRDEHARRIAAGEARLREAEQLQGRTARDRDARAQDVERLHEQLAALERSRAAAEAERDEARAGWEAERQGLQEQGERRRRELLEDAERRLAELRAQFDAERQAWDQRAAAGREHEPLQQETERARDLLDASRRERDAALQRLEAAGGERDLLHARIEEAEAGRREAERSGQAERDRLIAALEQARRESGAAAELGAKHAEEVRTLRAELERQRRDREVRDEEKEGSLAALRRDWEVERRRWLELLGAAHPEVLPDGPAPGNDRPSPPCGDSAERSTTTQATAARPQGSGIEPITPTFRRTGGHGRPPRRRGAATPLRARPQASSYHDPETFRSHLEQWLAEAQARLQGMNAPPGRSGNEASSTWLEYEIRTAREEIALLEQSQGPGPKDPVGRSVVHLERA